MPAGPELCNRIQEKFDIHCDGNGENALLQYNEQVQQLS